MKSLFIDILIFIVAFLIAIGFNNHNVSRNGEKVQFQNNLKEQSESFQTAKNEHANDYEDYNKISLSDNKVSDARVQQNRKNIQEHIGENYLDNVLSDGKLIRWNPKSFPLKVYIDSRFPKEYSQQIKNAFLAWQKSSDDFLTFDFTSIQIGADFEIWLPKKLRNRSCVNNTGVAGYQYFMFKKDGSLNKSVIELSIVDCKNKPYSMNIFYSTVLHEIGHGLGISGHSVNKNDLMYPVGNVAEISESDLTTLRAIYSIVPDVTNEAFTDEDKKTLITTNDLWGNSRDEIEMEVNKKNLAITPQTQQTRLSMARSYVKNKQYDNALKEYGEALKFTDNDKSASEIYVEVAKVYMNMNKLSDAQDYLDKAMSYDTGHYVINGYNYLAYQYSKNNNYEKSLEVLKKVENYAKKDHIEKDFFQNMIIALVKLERYEEAETYLNTYKNYMDKGFVSLEYTYLSYMYGKKKDFNKTIMLLNEAEKYVTNDDVRKLIYKTYRWAYANLKNVQMAEKYNKLLEK